MAKDVTLHLSKLPMDDDEKLLETLKQMARRLPTGEGKNRVLDHVRQTNCTSVLVQAGNREE